VIAIEVVDVVGSTATPALKICLCFALRRKIGAIHVGQRGGWHRC
jgi:hypothetical protein